MYKRGKNIYKRKDGIWKGKYKLYEKMKYQSAYIKNHKDVKEKLKINSCKNDIFLKAKNKNIKFRDILNLWIESNQMKLKGSTKNKYEYIIERHILPQLGDINVACITSPLLNDFMQKKLTAGRIDGKGGLSVAYVKGIMIIITSALKYAVSEELCLPLKKPLYKLISEKKRIKILNLKEQQKLEKAIIDNIDSTKLGVLISLHTGLRIGEICALLWEDIDFSENIIHVRSTVSRVKCSGISQKTELIIDKPKTKSSIRDIPISSILLPILLKMKNQSAEKYVISNKNTFISPRTFEYRYHKLLDKYNIKQINFHALRHTFATRCIEVGMDVKTLSEILGHANVSITLNTYVHPSMELKRMQIEKLSKVSA